MTKIFFDEQGNIGTIIGSDILPVRENEKMVCTESEATALGLRNNEWITLEALRDLPNIHADIAYKILTGTLNQ